ncbi:Asp23/Gls24 family envelope stress response protein [Tomitella fengzijianii]|uniref:Asp23/Gls24 family envelope stress response protein n=1 Tax=Tomitella fengzijianii TaxID=2597660 RepID=UPI00131CCC53|nr:Asp23/Gls24 family envelope stress response protein [Tomitella fengzijianii]
MAEPRTTTEATHSAPADGTPADDGGPGSRGTLVIRDRVVSRIACAEVLAVDGVVRSSEGLDRVRGRGLPRALAVIDGAEAAVAVRIATRWPVSLPSLTESVQTRVADRIEELTGLHVRQVDVTVERIAPSVPAGEAIARRVT